MRTARRHTRGVLSADEVILPCALVWQPRSGHAILSVPPYWVHAADLVLSLPDDGAPEVEASCVARELDASTDESVDWYRAYHGDGAHPRWIELRAECWRMGGAVWDGDEVTFANPLIVEIGALCRELNAAPGVLQRACEMMHHFTPETPVCVGVDQFGLDVRTRFQVVRVEFPEACPTGDAVRRSIRGFLASA